MPEWGCPVVDLAAWFIRCGSARARGIPAIQGSQRLEAVQIGYGRTVLMAVLFLVLGPWVMHGTPQLFAAGCRFLRRQ